MRLLFITQKVHGQDAFVHLWVQAFQRRGYEMQLLCLSAPPESVDIPLVSMGKEEGVGKCRQVWNFWRAIVRLRYDRVFIHMSPVWYALGFPWWVIKGIPAYLWYTHYEMQLGVRLFGWFGRRFFCATDQSLPQFQGSAKKVVTGHGIDLGYWGKTPNRCMSPHQLLMVHRLSRSKRVELVLCALTLLPQEYTLDIYGVSAEPDYVTELHALVAKLGLSSRITFHGTVPMERLREIYPQHRFAMNMASETIDKTMLEAMTAGCYPVTTRGNAEAIGLSAAPTEDTPEAIATFVQSFTPPSMEVLYSVVRDRHSLEAMVGRMDAYMRLGQ